ncbi:AlpA family phage regulatory protein [Xylella taiwanensis]|uniref:AlpA family phage regulatory protein n=1 Tax=Xylella taiwanensis TaxID=1444770 RepID=Z9JK46_9GAMM|nr:AlpA family phage regulatory protein [Xylella taiwanensis]AXI82908.1 hypothetical protein AB672_02535 [Xylella taiwanensis]EWS78368.1 AlpA family transcriptional regulator [Xylella taiwanensis]MCD8455928.1 AlpA family phage regulatory protein [Xylella taiwanensis]MCD8458331.1 AlpA family phage regulatory protein [Xylella taiwanensis]MCD8460470.1 AlpA family phage regulatory protein [Xylella taiwanensis]
MSERIMRLPEVILRNGLSRSSIYSREDFLKPVKLGPNMSEWVEREIDAWGDAKIKQRDDDAANEVMVSSLNV